MWGGVSLRWMKASGERRAALGRTWGGLFHRISWCVVARTLDHADAGPRRWYDPESSERGARQCPNRQAQSELSKLNDIVKRQGEQLSFLLLTQTLLVRAIGMSLDDGLKEAVRGQLEKLFVEEPGAGLAEPSHSALVDGGIAFALAEPFASDLDTLPSRRLLRLGDQALVRRTCVGSHVRSGCDHPPIATVHA